MATLLRTAVPRTWRWTQFPAGERRDARTGAKLKRMGLMPGWPDFLILSPGNEYRHGRLHCLELKRKGETMRDEQAEFAAWCADNRIEHAVADTFDGAVYALQRWGALPVSIGTRGAAA